MRGACATSDAHPRDASRQQSDSAKPSLARAVRDAALSNGALTEITRALSQSTRDGAAPKAALAWHPTKEILATTDDGGRCATRDAAMDVKGAVRARQRRRKGWHSPTHHRMGQQRRRTRELSLHHRMGSSRLPTRRRTDSRRRRQTDSSTARCSPEGRQNYSWTHHRTGNYQLMRHLEATC